MLASIALDDQVDAQPLIVPRVMINGRRHTLVYIATEGNTIYALDAKSGKVLLQTNFGTPVHWTDLPDQCSNNGPNVGIDSTPVIDPSSGTMYVIVYTWENSTPVYRIHALSVSTLRDTVTPVVITASGTLTNGKTYEFNPVVSRQRAALLLSNNTIYAGFSSFCDADADKSRGWVLGWQAGTLTPLANNRLTNEKAKSTNKFFLSSVWMSGYGLAANSSGSVFFSTGNSDPGGGSYNKVTNIEESVVQMSPDLSTVQSLFTPTGHAQLDSWDGDFSAGGVLLLPPQPGTHPDIAAGAGKDGYFYVLNADNLSNEWGVYVLNGDCWCGPSYFQASDGVGRIVTSGGKKVEVWTVTGDPPTLTRQFETARIANGEDGGFFTTVSSNGTASGTGVIWGVGRPIDQNHTTIDLYAFNADTGDLLFDGIAGDWPHLGANCNTVPVVANGLAYVVSNQMLTIFGTGAKKGAVSLPKVKVEDMRVPLGPGHHEVFAVVKSISGASIVASKRNGDLLRIDSSNAIKNFSFAQPKVGRALVARGTYTAAGVLQADTVLHAKKNPGTWPADR
jgi:hypothetical protein